VTSFLILSPPISETFLSGIDGHNKMEVRHGINKVKVSSIIRTNNWQGMNQYISSSNNQEVMLKEKSYFAIAICNIKIAPTWGSKERQSITLCK
jgi:hypothetical protein